MKILKKIARIALLLATIIQFSCSNNSDEQVVAPAAENIPFTEVWKGFIFGGTPVNEQSTIVTNQTQWDNLLLQMNPNGGVSSPIVNSNIDFSTDCLIVLIDIIRPHTGFTINIDSIAENSSNIVVSKFTTSSLNGYSITTRPFHIVKIPIQTKPIVFR